MAFSGSADLQLAFRDVLASIVAVSLPDGEAQQQSMDAGNITVLSVAVAAEVGGRRLQGSQGTQVEVSVALEGAAAEPEGTTAVGTAVESSAQSGDLATRLNADERFS